MPRIMISRMVAKRLLLNFIRKSSTSGKSMNPLQGIRVLDMSRILAGPYCSMILGDLGAEIIKIEQPGSGDDTRNWGPPFIESEDGTKESCYFLSVNRNKKSLAINFRTDEGRKILTKLAVKSDVLLENFVPGKLSKLGLDYDSLKEKAPGLIYCSITGFGESGPYSNRPGYDVIAASIGGLMHITGPKDGAPCKVGVAMTDLATGLYAHGAIMAALLQRIQTGKGQKISCDLLSTQVSALVNLGSNYLNGQQEANRWGTEHASIVPYQTFRTKDGYYTIGCGNDAQFKDFCQRLHLSDLPFNPKFQTNSLRVQHRKELIFILEEEMQKKSNKEWSGLLTDAKFPNGPVNNFQEVFNDPQVIHNGMVQTISDDIFGEIKQVGPAVKFSMAENGPKFSPPRLGQHTNEILNGILGYTSDEIIDLRKNKIIQ